MNTKLTTTEAKKLILTGFTLNTEPISESQKFSNERMIEVLGAIYYSIPFTIEAENEKLCRFLYAGCVRFDRWYTPTPYIVTENLSEHFKRFLMALQKVDRTTENTGYFQARLIQNELYNAINEKPITGLNKVYIKDLILRVNKIQGPKNPDRNINFQAQKAELLQVLKGLESGNFKTVYKSSIPYIIAQSKLEIKCKWHDIAVIVTINPKPQPSPDTIVTSQQVVQSIGATKWQQGISEVVYEFDALIDSDVPADSLQAVHGFDTPISGWPRCFEIGFSILDDLVWQLRVNYQFQNQWIVSPRDLGSMETQFSAQGRSGLFWKLKDSPANPSLLYSPIEQTREIDLTTSVPIQWSQKCKSTASMYLELGETNEVLFWLNVGVEALLQERFNQISEQLKNPDIDAYVNNKKGVWDEAEQIVSKQYPSMAGEIKWPDKEMHVPIYKKLDRLAEKVTLRASAKDIKKHYSRVSSARNSLFHGSTQERISLEDVIKAMESYEWLEQNFELTDGS